MGSKSSFSKGLGFLGLLGFLAACSSGNSDAELAAKAAQKRQEMRVELANVSPDGCLNLQKYYEVLRGLDSDVRARRLPTKFQVRTTGSSLPRNFYLRLALGNFQLSFLDGSFAEVSQSFLPMVQDSCKTVTFAAEGHQNVYKIVKSKSDSITFDRGWDGITTVKWTSPTSLEISTTSEVADQLCSGSSEAAVTTIDELTWGDDSVFTATLAEQEIDPNYLSLVSEATGYQLNTLYSDLSSPVLSTDPNTTPPTDPVIVTPAPPADPTTPETPIVNPGENGVSRRVEPVNVSDRRLVVSKLKELAIQKPRTELFQCY